MVIMKNNIIRQLYDYCEINYNINDGINIFSFLLNDNKFVNWDKYKSTRYTKTINKFLSSNNIKYEYGLTQEELRSKRSKCHIRIAGQGRQSELLLKGIRNGIVHLNAKLKKINNVDYIIIDDVSAKIQIPVIYIGKIYKMYKKMK